MAVEVEARFRADGIAALDALREAASLGQASLGETATFDEVDRYLDTADGRLAAARWACRLRSRGSGWRVSLKGPQGAGTGANGWLHRRPELEGPAADSTDPRDWPPSAARDLLNELGAGRRLVERLRLRQRRSERGVVLSDGQRLGTLSLDAVVVAHGSRDAGEFAIVELELAGEDTAAAEERLLELAQALASMPALRPEPRTKLELALALLPSE